MASKVYFTNFRTTFREGLLPKMRRLMVTAGIENIDFAGKYVAIKMHFGELGNFAYLRPNYVKAVADLIRELPKREQGFFRLFFAGKAANKIYRLYEYQKGTD